MSTETTNTAVSSTTGIPTTTTPTTTAADGSNVTPAPTTTPTTTPLYIINIPGRTSDGNLLSRYFPFYDKSWSSENIKNDLDALKTFHESKTMQTKVIAVVEDTSYNVNIYYNACETFIISTTTTPTTTPATSTVTDIPK